MQVELQASFLTYVYINISQFSKLWNMKPAALINILTTWYADLTALLMKKVKRNDLKSNDRQDVWQNSLPKLTR